MTAISVNLSHVECVSRFTWISCIKWIDYDFASGKGSLNKASTELHDDSACQSWSYWHVRVLWALSVCIDHTCTCSVSSWLDLILNESGFSKFKIQMVWRFFLSNASVMFWKGLQWIHCSWVVCVFGVFFAVSFSWYVNIPWSRVPFLWSVAFYPSQSTMSCVPFGVTEQMYLRKILGHSKTVGDISSQTNWNKYHYCISKKKVDKYFKIHDLSCSAEFAFRSYVNYCVEGIKIWTKGPIYSKTHIVS